MIPCRLLVPHMRSFFRRWETSAVEIDKKKLNGYTDGYFTESETYLNNTNYSPMVIMAGHIGVHQDNLRRILNLTKETVRFDTADRIISFMDPTIWFTDPELSAYYDV